MLRISRNKFDKCNAIVSIMTLDYEEYLSGWKNRLDAIDETFLRIVRGGA